MSIKTGLMYLNAGYEVGTLKRERFIESLLSSIRTLENNRKYINRDLKIVRKRLLELKEED